MKKAVILGGGYDQVSLIRELNERDYQTILVDYYENPPGKKIAKKHYCISTHNYNEVDKVIKKESPQIIASVGNDPVVPIIAKLCEKYNIQSNISYSNALKATNKKLMKETFHKFKINSPKIFTPLENFLYPIIVKPIIGTSSRGVFKAETKNELDSYFESNGYGRDEVIIEEFIEGDEISVDCIVVDSKAVVVNVTQLFQNNENNKTFSFSHTQSPYPFYLDIKSEIEDIAQKISSAFGITYGPFFFQAKIKKGKIYVLEMGARIAGGYKTELIKEATNIDTIRIYINQLEGKKVDIPNINYIRYCSQIYVYSLQGKLNDIIFEKDDNIKLNFLKKKGEILSGGTTAKDRIAIALISSDSLPNLRDYQLKFIDNLKVIGDNCKDIKIINYN